MTAKGDTNAVLTTSSTLRIPNTFSVHRLPRRFGHLGFAEHVVQLPSLLDHNTVAASAVRVFAHGFVAFSRKLQVVVETTLTEVLFLVLLTVVGGRV